MDSRDTMPVRTRSRYETQPGDAGAPLPSPSRPSQKLFGILTRKERWGLSWRGRLVVLLVAFLAGCSFFWGIYPFLALTDRVDAEFLVVEGWLDPISIRRAVEEFSTGSYQLALATGGPVAGSGGYTNDYNTTASVTADLLKAAGLPSHLLQMVPSRVMSRNRTYSSATALRDWFLEHSQPVRGINIVTEGIHARRTRMLFREALGDRVLVGVISTANPDYDPTHWWQYSQGVRDVIGETITYAYAALVWLPVHRITRSSL
jgi:uncharacterized SAM-binding protein YcdF (DUF218 family)